MKVRMLCLQMKQTDIIPASKAGSSSEDSTSTDGVLLIRKVAYRPCATVSAAAHRRDTQRRYHRKGEHKDQQDFSSEKAAMITYRPLTFRESDASILRQFLVQ